MVQTDLRIAGLAALLLSAAGITAALAGDRETVMESCAANLKLDEAGCTCVADRSEAELNETQYAFFIANISGDREFLSRPSTMTQDEAMGVMNFMTTAPSQCQAG